ncbi:MAG: hypothetical protein AB1491_04810 [Thermodesulfobacteriota bacterium]
MASQVTLKQGEAKTLTLTVTEAGQAVDLSGATLFLGVKRYKTDTAYTFSKNDGDFNKTQAAQGMVSVFLTGADTDREPGAYVGELKAAFPGSVVEKSTDWLVLIEAAVTD